MPVSVIGQGLRFCLFLAKWVRLSTKGLESINHMEEEERKGRWMMTRTKSQKKNETNGLADDRCLPRPWYQILLL
jgi:hypothetical protein